MKGTCSAGASPAAKAALLAIAAGGAPALRESVTVLALAAALGLSSVMEGGHAAAAEWKPDRYVELVVGTAPGGSQDNTMRTIQRIIQEKKLVPAPVNVVNKPGGNGSVSMRYVAQFPGDGRVLLLGSPTTMTTNHVMG